MSWWQTPAGGGGDDDSGRSHDDDDDGDEYNDDDGFDDMQNRVGGGLQTNPVEGRLTDAVNQFDTLDQDVLRDDQASDNESDEGGNIFGFGGYGKDRKKKEGEEEEERDPSELVEFFDFRRGPKHWPRGVELIPEEKGRELVEAALEEANKKQEKDKNKQGGDRAGAGERGGMSSSAGGGGGGGGDKKRGAADDDDDIFGGSSSKTGAGGKKGDGSGGGTGAGGDDDNDLTKSGEVQGPIGPGLPYSGFMSAPSSEEESLGEPDDELIDPDAAVRAKENPAPPEAEFAYQRDRSTALVIKPGQRLKLDISGLKHDGLEKKKKAERQRVRQALMSSAAKARAEKKEKEKKKRQSAYAFYDFDVAAWEKDFGIKTFVNEYTITFDLKLRSEPPREGLALFQTSLVYTEENPSSGRKTIKQSDGEAVIGANGGVGIFGQFGDVVRAKCEVDRWRRVTISIRNVAEGKGEMRTWVDGIPCALIKRDAFSLDGRFSLDAESLYLFSSQKSSMMTGDVLLRCVRIQHGVSTDDMVKSQHAKDKIISMHEEERMEKAEQQRKGLSLAQLFPKPRPLWMAATLIGAVGDPFIERTPYEGSSVLSWSYKVLHFAFRRCVEHQDVFMTGFSHESRQVVSDVLNVMHQSSVLMNHMLKLLMHPSDSQVMSFLTRLRKCLAAVGVGDSLLLPVNVEDYELIIIVERTSEQMFRFVVVETSAERGLNHHGVNPTLGPKLKYRTALVLNNVPKKNALDNVFWMAVYANCTRTREGDLMRFYDVLLPFLTGKPLETSLWEAEEIAAKQDEAKATEEDRGGVGEYCSPQRSQTAYVRTIFHALKHMMRTKGLGRIETKQVLLALRAQLVTMLDNDLQFVHPDDNGQRVCRMACAQLSYAAVKLSNAMEAAKHPSAEAFANAALTKAKEIVDSVSGKLGVSEDNELELPPQLDLRNKVAKGGGGEEAEGKEHDSSSTTMKEAKEDHEPLEKEDCSGVALEVVVKHGEKDSVKIKVFSTSKIVHVQDRVATLLGIGVSEQRLIYMGRVLKPESTIAQCELKDQTTIQLTLNPGVVAKALAGGSATRTTTGAAQKTEDEKRRAIRSALRRDPDAPAMMTQFMDAFAWDTEQSYPNPGQAISLRKYVPIDVLQMPSRVETRDEAVRAIRLCDRLCTLLDHQPHCIKNDRFLIASLIQYTFTQLVPHPKPRGVDAQTAAAGGRMERRRQRKVERRTKKKERREAKLSKKDEGTTTPAVAADTPSTNVEVAPSKKDNATSSTTTAGHSELPDFTVGTASEKLYTEQACIWDADITYQLQVELLIELQRLTEHFIAGVFSIQQDRAFDSVAIVTLGCICAIADAVIRRRAVDHPSEVCSHLMGQTRDGRQLGVPGYGVSPASFATQTETIEAHTPELCIARAAVLDYFLSPRQRRLEKIFNWERHFELKPDRALIKYMRSVQREIAHSDATPHLLLLDGTPVESSLLKKNYPELRCYRDVCFYWKCLMNPDIKAFPNYLDVKRPDSSGSLNRFGRLAAQLHWGWEQSQTTAGYVVWCQMQGISLKCRPEPDRDARGETFSKDRQPPTHRYPSTATPSFYVPDLPVIKTEDDVIYRPNLPGFEDDPVAKKISKALLRGSRGGLDMVGSGGGGGSKKKKLGQQTPARVQILGQHDSELLISYLTVPYLRLPLVLTFFASDDRLHKLQSRKLRAILDSVMFEPGRYLPSDMVGVAPTMIPTPHQQLLSTSFGLLLNELVRSPDTVLSALDALLEGGLALDTGSVCDLGEEDFNVSVDIILYIARLGTRVESFVSFLVDVAQGEHECFSRKSSPTLFRDLEVTPDCLQKLLQGRAMLRKRLLCDFDELFEDYLKRLDSETRKDPNNEKLVDRNSRLAADLHAVKILFHRNTRPEEYTQETARTLIGSFVFLTTRHTWNKATRELGRLLVPETELYEVLQVQRRRLITYCRSVPQGPLDEVMQTALQVSTSATGSFRASGEIVDAHNRWAKIGGDRSCGRFAVGSTRTVGEDEATLLLKKASSSATPGGTLQSFVSSSSSTASNGNNKPVPLIRQRSHQATVGEVADSGILGVELDLQIGQMTLRSKHLSALPSDVANHPDVRAVFGTATIQASLLERAQHRTVFRLVGLHHDIESWQTPHMECPQIPEAFERDYDPSELFDSESWIPPLFEPVRKSFFDGPINPPPMQFLMVDKPLPEHAELAILIGVNQSAGGAYKLVFLFRRLRTVHVYQAVSHGRRFWWTLHMTTDVRFCYRELQPAYASRQMPPPAWWRYGSGDPYPPGNSVPKFLFDDIESPSGTNSICERSVLILRDAAHPDNLSNGKELLVPRRFLLGLVPQCLLEAYRFWRDESGDQCKGRLGYIRMLGYPLDEEDEYMIRVEIQGVRQLEITGHMPSRSLRIVRRLKTEVARECERNRRIAEVLEQNALLARDTKKARKERRMKRLMKRKQDPSSRKRDGTSAYDVAAASTASDEDEDEDADEDAGDADAGADEGKGRGENDDDGDDDADDEDDDEDGSLEDVLVVGGIIEYAFRTNTWSEAQIVAVYEDDTLDVELRGDVHAGLVLRGVHVRDCRKKKLTDLTAGKDDEDDEGEGGGGISGRGRQQQQQQQNMNARGQKGKMLVKSRMVKKASASNRANEGEGVWHWDGMSDSDDADWASKSSGEEDDEDEDEDEDGGGGGDGKEKGMGTSARSKKNALTFAQIDQLGLLVEACGASGDEALCLDALRALPPPPEPLTSVMKLARILGRFVQQRNASEAGGALPPIRKLVSNQVVAHENDFVLLNTLYAPKASRLHSLMKTLTRIENMSYILVWTKASNLSPQQRLHSPDPHVGITSIDLVELPRLKLSFTARPDHSGVIRLYSLDHADLFISNERNAMTSTMLEGIPHSLLLCNTQNETSVLVPVVSVQRPVYASQPFSTALVLDRNDGLWNMVLSQRYFIYPVHVSLSFLMSKGIDSGLYLLLLRFFHRDYKSVFRLADAIASDSMFSPAGQAIFKALLLANDDFHPDAHACRMKISLVTIDSGVRLPWDLTLQCARYITKLPHISAECRISLEEELQLLDTEGAIVYDTKNPKYNKGLHSPYVRALVRNRQQALTGLLGGKDKVSCYAPPRPPLSNWPYYTDMTVFGVVYEEMIEIKTQEEFEDALNGE